MSEHTHASLREELLEQASALRKQAARLEELARIEDGSAPSRPTKLVTRERHALLTSLAPTVRDR